MTLKPIHLGVAGIIVGLVLGLAYGHLQIESQQKASQIKMKQMNQRMAQAERKHEHDLADQQSSFEDERRQVQDAGEKLQKEKDDLAAENKELKARVEVLTVQSATVEQKRAQAETKAAAQKSKNQELTALLAKTETEKKDLAQKQHQTLKALQEREKDLKALNGSYDRCAENNVRLYDIGQELVKQYQNKGLMRTIVQNEPFTQVKKVELEKLVQEYLDRIDKQKLEPK